jgi:hypothetical protein
MKTLIASIVILVGVSAVAQQTNTLDSLRQSYETKQRFILAQYGKGLDTTMADVKKKGDLDSVLILQAEQQRFGAEKTVPDPKDAKPQFSLASQAYYQAMVALLGQYAASLDTLIKKEVTADRIEQAKVVKTEKDKIDFMLADMQTKSHAKSLAPTPQSASSRSPTPNLKDTQTPGEEEVSQHGSWISPEVPAPAPGGWITLFDGVKLYGCGVPPEQVESKKVSVENGSLRLDGVGITFNVRAKNVLLRVQAKKVTGENLHLTVRLHEQEDVISYQGYFKGGSSFGMCRPRQGGKLDDLGTGRSRRQYDGFFTMELAASDNRLTLTAEGKPLVQTTVADVISDGRVRVSAWRGVSLFRRIEVKILDEKR